MLLALVPAALAWLAHLAGWPREQVLITGILSASVLLWITASQALVRTLIRDPREGN